MKNLIFILTLLLLAGCTSHVLRVTDTHQMPDGTAMDRAMHMAEITSEQQFLTEMIPHHQEAVDTSQIILENTANPALKKFVAEVIEVQSKEIEQMKTWQEPNAPEADYMPMMNIETLAKLTGQAQDDLYIAGMIFHHQGAIQMAKQLLDLPNLRLELKQFAEAIISTQAAEVEFLESL